jgi:hypothetical protein
MTPNQLSQPTLVATPVAKAMAAPRCQTNDVAPAALATAVTEVGHTKGTVSNHDHLEASRQQLANLVEDKVDLLPIVTIILSEVLLPERPGQRQCASLLAERDAEEVDLVGLGAVVDGEDELARGTKQVGPVKDLMEDGSIAEGRNKIGVVESAAQAAFDVFGAGSVGEVEGGEFSGDLFEDGGRGGNDAGDEQGEAGGGRAADGGRQGSGDALKDGLVQWVVSRHSRSPG